MGSPLVALAGFGAAAGVSLGYAIDHQTTNTGTQWTTMSTKIANNDLAGTSEFYLRIEPTRIIRNGGEETIELQARVGSVLGDTVEAILSIQVEDDTGNVVQPASASYPFSLASQMEASTTTQVTSLPDGWHRIRAQAVFVEAGRTDEARGSEADSLYLEVRDGEIFFTDMTEWFSSSNANLGRP